MNTYIKYIGIEFKDFNPGFHQCTFLCTTLKYILKFFIKRGIPPIKFRMLLSNLRFTELEKQGIPLNLQPVIIIHQDVVPYEDYAGSYRIVSLALNHHSLTHYRILELVQLQDKLIIKTVISNCYNFFKKSIYLSAFYVASFSK